MGVRLQAVMTGIALVPLLCGCCAIPLPVPTITGSGRVVTVKKEFSGFSRLDVSNAFRVEVSQGDDFLVTVLIDDNLEEHLQLERQGDTLRIGLEPGHPSNLGDTTLEAEVTMPELTGLALSGASRGTVESFRSTKLLDIDVSGASQLRGRIEAGDGRIKASGASQVDLSGSANDVTVGASGASQLDLSGLEVNNADVETSGASTVSIDCSGRLDVRASGASRVRYRGNPSMGRIDTSGASSVARD
jgi:hypothetical protein